MVGALFAGLLLASCSDAPLSQMGQLTERWIAAAPQPTTPVPTPATPAPLGLLAIDGAVTVEWVNDELGVPQFTLPEQVVAGVWQRSNREDRYLQASRAEIAAALPGLEFPELIPENVAFITSQLIFEPSTGQLSSDTLAAFGFWSVKPYSQNRSVAQLAVLMVSEAEAPEQPVVADTIGVPEPAVETRCKELGGSTVEDCQATTLADGCRAWSLDVTDGWRLVWSAHGYEYDLFVRSASNTDLLARMAGSCSDLAPAPSVAATETVDGTQAEISVGTPVGASDS